MGVIPHRDTGHSEPLVFIRSEVECGRIEQCCVSRNALKCHKLTHNIGRLLQPVLS